MVESRHIEIIIKTDEINPLKRMFRGFFTLLKTENRWLSNVLWGYRIEHSLKMG